MPAIVNAIDNQLKLADGKSTLTFAFALTFLLEIVNLPLDACGASDGSRWGCGSIFQCAVAMPEPAAVSEPKSRFKLGSINMSAAVGLLFGFYLQLFREFSLS